MLFDNIKPGYTYDDLLLIPGYSEINSREDPILYSELAPGLGFDIPVISANMNKITEGRMIKAMCDLGATSVLHRFLHTDQIIQIINESNEDKKRKFGISVGVNKIEVRGILDRIKNEDVVSFVVVDVAHGHHSLVRDTIKIIKEEYGHVVVAGNICTGYAAINLAKWGANCCKVGIGPGSQCTTRQVTGFGYPQLSAVREVYEYLKAGEYNTTIIADGGIRHTGDIVKALAAGASFVMLGGMLAGTKETPGNVLTTKEKKYKLFEGMASIDSQVNFFNKESDDIIPEGEAGLVPYKGSVYRVINNIRGSVKAGLSYAGCRNIKELHEFGNSPDNWVKITHSGYIEGTPHGT